MTFTEGEMGQDEKEEEALFQEAFEATNISPLSEETRQEVQGELCRLRVTLKQRRRLVKEADDALYVPTGRKVKVNSPAALERVELVALVSSFARLTGAEGIAALVGSVMVPYIVAVVTCT
jgi:hypothetical protein